MDNPIASPTARPERRRAPTSLYLGSFPGGFEPLVRRLVERDFGPAAVEGLDGSSVRFRAPGKIGIPPYLQALSLVLASCKERSLENASRWFSRHVPADALAAFLERMRPGARFALRTFDQGQPSAVDPRTRRSLEDALRSITGLTPDSLRPQVEFCVLTREGGDAFLTAPLRSSALSVHDRGALPPSTARLLLELAGAERDDVFLDPFMGSGALPLERARMGPYAMIFAADVSKEKVDSFKALLGQSEWAKRRKTIFPKELDARDLGRFEDGFFSAIVTDPPWGAWERIPPEELADLYRAFLAEAARVLKPSGRLVMLGGREGPLDRLLETDGASWDIGEKLPVLVSGRKATVWNLSKRG